jgi:predicted enzyme related to lactoylglutathione lyase
MDAPVTWFEISTSQPKAVREVYAQQFGWSLQVLEGSNYARPWCR